MMARQHQHVTVENVPGNWLELTNAIVPKDYSSLVNIDYKPLLTCMGKITVAVSEDRLGWTNLYEEHGSDTYITPIWKTIVIDLSTYAGKAIFLRIGYDADWVSGCQYSYWYGGGIWIDQMTFSQISTRTWQAVDEHVDAATRSYTIRNTSANVPQIWIEAMVDNNWVGSAFRSVIGVGKTNQTITFGVTPITFGTAPTVAVGGSGTLSATGSLSGSPVTFSATTPSVCTVSGSTVTGVTASTPLCQYARDTNYLNN
ncbi:hypothetical protein CCP3SC15_30058 [Gammaproteobacteria bacterium]